MSPLHLDSIAGVIAIHREGRNEDRTINSDLVHRRHHLVAGDVVRPVRNGVPGPLEGVRLIGVDLGVDDHWGNSIRHAYLTSGPVAVQYRTACCDAVI